MRRVLSETDLREFRDRVCSAAAELLTELGYDGFNMRELAARLGVSAMTTYRYFESKDDIIAALRAQALNRLADRLENLHDHSGSKPERFLAFCRGYVDFAREEPVRYRLMFDHSPPQIAGSAEVTGARQRMFQVLADHADSIAHQSETCPRRLAQNIWASLHGLAALTVMETICDSELDGLLLDMVQRFAGAGAISDFAHKHWDAATDGQAGAPSRSNGASASGWIPVPAAE